MIELFKFVVQPVVLERDADGQIIGEKTGEALALYTDAQLYEYTEAIRSEISAQNAASAAQAVPS